MKIQHFYKKSYQKICQLEKLSLYLHSITKVKPIKTNKIMKAENLVVNYIKRGFLGCHLRSTADVVERLQDDLGCSISVVNTTETSFTLRFEVEGGLDIQFILAENPLNGIINWVREIKII